MVKSTFSLVAILFFLASCSSLKPINSGVQKPAPETSRSNAQVNKSVTFIENIEVSPASESNTSAKKTAHSPKSTSKSSVQPTNEQAPGVGFYGNRSAGVENASPIQLKYAVLLNTEVEQLQNKALLESMDQWYGTRYRMGGTSKLGIDCSAFVQAIFASAFSFTLPRTAREQYKVARKISRTELREGDLLFFNTTGGVSHVGIYLQNNKFIHASATKGVTISDMFEPYYLKKFIAAGRVDNIQNGLSANNSSSVSSAF